jgi:hypothetical protein
VLRADPLAQLHTHNPCLPATDGMGRRSNQGEAASFAAGFYKGPWFSYLVTIAATLCLTASYAWRRPLLASTALSMASVRFSRE